jgi:hypothetical protein
MARPHLRPSGSLTVYLHKCRRVLVHKEGVCPLFATRRKKGEKVPLAADFRQHINWQRANESLFGSQWELPNAKFENRRQTSARALNADEHAGFVRRTNLKRN